MSNAWFRMYSEFAFDPKVQMMSEIMQRRLVMLFCNRCTNVASVATPVAELCFMLRISEAELEETKTVFLEKGFIDATWNLLHWEKRQYTSKSSTERSRRFREKRKTKNETHMQRDATVATLNATSCNAPEQNRTDTEQIEKESKEKELSVDNSKKPAVEVLEKKNVARGTRLPADWELEQDWGDWAVAQGLSADEVIFQAEKFKDWWVSKAGAGGIKVDWQATWRNWIRTCLERRNNEIQTKKYR